MSSRPWAGGPRRAAGALAAVIALAGCGSSAPAGTRPTTVAPPSSAATPAQTASTSTTVTLRLHGGSSLSMTACGAEHHYWAYAVGAIVRYTGVVSPIPSGRWKVKLKIKVCTGATFREVGKIEALRDKHTGAYMGSFQAPAAGVYEARATLYLNGSENAKSRKRHFVTR